MDKLSKNIPILGDDLGYTTMRYSNVPKGFRFADLVYPDDCPLTFALKDKLNAFADLYFRKYEIVGETVKDFHTNLQIDLTLNIDTLEKALEVYNDDISKPTQSRTIKRTYDITDTDTQTGKNVGKTTTSNNTESTDYEIPYDNPSAQAVNKTVGLGNVENNNNLTSESDGTRTHKGTEVEDWSDVGVAPNYELLNGFLDSNRTYYYIFVNFFKDDFTLSEVYYG